MKVRIYSTHFISRAYYYMPKNCLCVQMTHTKPLGQDGYEVRIVGYAHEKYIDSLRTFMRWGAGSGGVKAHFKQVTLIHQRNRFLTNALHSNKCNHTVGYLSVFDFK